MFNLITSLVCGFIFAIGLGISGMTQPQKVIAFLDVFGSWNPSLAFVMMGAISVHALSYFISKKIKSPLFDKHFPIIKKNLIDSKLLIGSALFGVGWGLGGFCPGPALTSLPSGSKTVFVFVASMAIGMMFYKLLGQIKGKE